MEKLTTIPNSLESDIFMERADDLQKNIEHNTSWSMEILPQNIVNASFIPAFINEVYITMIPGG